jgi:putative Holliday junction resolvase
MPHAKDPVIMVYEFIAILSENNMQLNFKKPTTLLALDFGTKSIGVAVGQTITKSAQAIGAIKAVHRGETNWTKIASLIDQWCPDAVVVGLPLNMDGTKQPLTKIVEKFVKELKRRFNLPVYTQDERLTSVEARSQLFEKGGYRAIQKKDVDALSAKLILEEWLYSMNLPAASHGASSKRH